MDQTCVILQYRLPIGSFFDHCLCARQQDPHEDRELGVLAMIMIVLETQSCCFT
jgi:hypothetical protein